ncbi:MAG: Stp1/IreP family PP2C-type Ser/Thr phosphatase [Nitrospirota bacterium]|nr:Stp1/IreP family PP2C-type Ser/Thr phosphatase [Candidatus Aminicenantes bacterium]MDH5769571.1 Stp1/IreP family PP2C-type Ser/Thr phosphatase [Nitrospirota bacterium]
MGKNFIQSLVAGSASDTGRVRKHNEDAYHVDVDGGLFLVSDGMGGAHAGTLASEVVVKILPQMIEERISKLKKPTSKDIKLSLCEAIIGLSQQIHSESRDQIGLKGMGATVVLALIKNRLAYIAHMGDSRAYIFRDNQLKQLTDDHSIVGILLRHGDITPEEAMEHPAKGRLSRYIGMDGEVYPEVKTITIKKDDRLLLCSDGLSGMLNDRKIAELLVMHPDPQAACNALLEAANAAGGKDNITVVIVTWEKCY